MRKIRNKILLFARSIIYRSLYSVDSVLSRKNNAVVIFCYHSIGSDKWRFSVNKRDFEKQIEYLCHHYIPITAEDLIKYIEGTKNITAPSFLITFDDGYQDVMEIKDILRKMKIKPVIFLIADKDNCDKKELGVVKEFLSKNQILDLIKDGWSIGCHSNSHRNFYQLNSFLLGKEVIESKYILEKELNVKVNYFSYPKGRYTPRVLGAVKDAGYKLAFSMDSGFVTKDTHPLKIPRVGVDNTHTFFDFQATFSPSVVQFRSVIFKNFIGKFYLKYGDF